MKPLRILRAFGVWNAGEIAGFLPERAAELIAGGFAAPIDPPQAAPAEPAPEPAPESAPEPAAEPEPAAAKPAKPAKPAKG